MWLRIFTLGLVSLLFVMPAGAADSGTVIGPDDIRGYLDAFVRDQRDFLPQAKIRCRADGLPEPFTLPPGRLDVEVIPASPRLLQSHRFTLIFRVDGEAVKNLAVRADIEALARVAVTTGDLRRGTVLTERDINLAEMDLSELRDPCFDLAELIGKELRRSLRRGQPLNQVDVVSPPVVKRGEMVTITAHKGALLITARGEARENGAEGDFIKVRNISSQKDLLCRVAASGQVEMEL
jgi:flagella basal body P-ring formation protein FlgA